MIWKTCWTQLRCTPLLIQSSTPIQISASIFLDSVSVPVGPVAPYNLNGTKKRDGILKISLNGTNGTNIQSDNVTICTSNYTILQSVETYNRSKQLLSTPGRGTAPYIFNHTLINNPDKNFIDWDTCEYARKLYMEPNAGGKSMNSEAFSINILNELYDVDCILTEMEVEYIWFNYKKCDYICKIYGQQVGVSVTRAMSYPDPSYFTSDDADKLLKKKMSGLMVARDGVIDKYNFDKCILHIWCESQGIADIIKKQYDLLDTETKDDIIILLTVTKPFSSPFIYYDTDSQTIRERIINELLE
jgi:hypothetical protein